MPDQGTLDVEPLGAPRIDEEGVYLPVDLTANLTLKMGGRQVWVIAPEHDGRPAVDGVRLVPWPELLRPHLDGETVMTLASLDSGRTVFEERVRLGQGEGTIDPRDAAG